MRTEEEYQLAKQETLEVLEFMQEWHKNLVQNLEHLSSKDSDFHVNGKEDEDPIVIKAGTEVHRGMTAVSSLLLDMFGKFPITINKQEE